MDIIIILITLFLTIFYLIKISKTPSPEETTSSNVDKIGRINTEKTEEVVKEVKKKSPRKPKKKD